MKRDLLAAGAAIAFFLMLTGVSEAGGRVAHRYSAPAVIHSQHYPVIVHGVPHGHTAWKNRHYYERYDRYHKRHPGRDVHYDRQRHYHGHVPGAWYQPGFSLSIGIW
ncbi:MAG: hypothetical protein C4576_00690 [Desulfobacteraceae bacterium]|nr:MAG: hypothetical protein C4576_00690 [Desulfobacteraceae bacterium]